MFKKDLAVKSDQKLSGKDAKKFIASVSQSLGDDASGLLGKKDLSMRRTGGGVVVTLYCNEAGALFFEADAMLIPSLLALWRAPMLPTLVVPEPVSAFLLKGADLMLPGVCGCEHWRADLKTGDAACVVVRGNPAPLVVGRLLVTGQELVAAMKAVESPQGRCLENLHVFGDALWKYNGRQLPNEGFSVSDSQKTVQALAGAKSADGDGDSDGDGDGGGDGDGNGDGDGDVTANGGAGETRQDGEDDGEPGGSDAADGGGDDDEDGQADKAAMDSLLRRCFLQAAHAVSDKQLPMQINSFYAQHMRPQRPAGTSLDVKRSSWKKLAPFMQALGTEGVCELGGKKGGEPLLVAIGRKHEAYQAHEVWEHTAAADERRQAEAGGPPPVAVALLYRPAPAQQPIFAALGERDPKAFYDARQVDELLDGYIGANGLLQQQQGAGPAAGDAGGGGGKQGGGKKGGGKQGGPPVTLDPLLTDALFKKKGQSQADAEAPLPTQLPLHELRRLFVAALDPWTRLSGGTLDKPALRPGRAPPAATISTAQRRGHAVTLVDGLEQLGLQPQVVARELQAVAGASAAVEEEVGQKGGVRRTVMVQGLWDRSAADLLTSKYGLPASCVENKAAGNKANMKQKQVKAATNVRRA